MAADHAESDVNDVNGVNEVARSRPGRWATRVGGAAWSLAAVGALLVVSLTACGGGGDDEDAGDGGRGTTTTEASSAGSEPGSGGASTSSSTTATTAADQGPAPSPGVGPDTPLSRSGIGPIRAGMTLRDAEAAAQVTTVPGEPLGPGATCLQAQIEGADLWLQLRISGTAGEDPRDGVVTVVSGEDARSTEEGVSVGDPVAEVTSTYGTATRTMDHPYVSGGQILVFEDGEHAYGVFTDGSEVVSLQSGARGSVPSVEGCA